MLINDLKVTKKKAKKTVGRGGVHGTYSTRGGKGQTARSGSSFYIGFEGGRSGLKRQLPKLGGFKSHFPKAEIVSLGNLDKHFNEGEEINSKTLAERGFIKNERGAVKILNNGEINKKIIISGCSASKGAKEKIEKAGGSVK